VRGVDPVLGLANVEVARGGHGRHGAACATDLDVAGGRVDARLALHALDPHVPARGLDAQASVDGVDVEVAGRTIRLDVAEAATGFKIRRCGAQVEIGLRRALNPELELGRAELDEPALLRDVDDDLEALATGPALDPDTGHDLPSRVVQRLELDAGLRGLGRSHEDLPARDPEGERDRIRGLEGLAAGVFGNAHHAAAAREEERLEAIAFSSQESGETPSRAAASVDPRAQRAGQPDGDGRGGLFELQDVLGRRGRVGKVDVTELVTVKHQKLLFDGPLAARGHVSGGRLCRP